MIIILDFGSQYTHLIARRIRQLSIYSHILPYHTTLTDIKKLSPEGIILSGSPDSVYQKDASVCSKEIFDLGIPVLGICYGMHVITKELGGEVIRGEKGEFGKTQVKLVSSSNLFAGIPQDTICWMSHRDMVKSIPDGFQIIAKTENCPVAGMQNPSKKIYALQFHPEVSHTIRGLDILRNFVHGICSCKPSWTMQNFIKTTIQQIREEIKNKRALCALSGGVDSSTSALLVNQAIGKNLVCIFVNHGLMRKGEPEMVLRTFKNKFGLNLVYVEASERFFDKLKGVSDPEQKRKIIGEEFIEVFSQESQRLGGFDFLVQGTIYPDVVESGKSIDRAARIKTHHNVAGLPDWMNFKLIEPLRSLYKDEVREVARLLGMPDEIVKRHPFPGPGLAVRIMGEITEEKVRICKEAGAIVEEELKNSNLYDRVWQAFAIVGDDRAVGVMGDERRFGHIITVRVVESIDGMTADWTRLPYDVLERIGNRIANEVSGVTWVSYTISSKPPSTIEPV